MHEFEYYCGLIQADSTNMFQDHFPGIGATIRLSQYKWIDPEGYGSINHLGTLGTDDVATTIKKRQKCGYMIWWDVFITAPCPHGYFTRAHNHRCYTYSYRYSYTSTEARDFCQTLGGYLLALETDKEFHEFKAWYLTGNCNAMTI